MLKAKIILAHLLSIAIGLFSIYVLGITGIEMIRDSDMAPSILLFVALPFYILFSFALLWGSVKRLTPYLIESFGVELSEETKHNISSIRHNMLNITLVIIVAIIVYRKLFTSEF